MPDIQNVSSGSNTSLSEQGITLNPPSVIQHTVMTAAFCLVTVISLLSNMLVVIVMARTKSLVGPVYTMLLSNLACADLLTGLFVVITPGFIINKALNIPEGFAGEVFCRIISSHYVIFTSGKVSIATITCLAVERWYAMARPLCHRSVYTRRRVAVYLVLIWCLCSLLNMRALFEKQPRAGLGADRHCQWTRLTEHRAAAEGYVLVLCTVTFLIPLVITWSTFIHLALLVKKSKGNPLVQGRRSRAAKQLLRMSCITAAVMCACWLPNQLVFVLAKHDITKLDSLLHHVTILLCLVNACANPWIHCASNRKYRRALVRLVCWQRCYAAEPGLPNRHCKAFVLNTCSTDYQATIRNKAKANKWDYYNSHANSITGLSARSGFGCHSQGLVNLGFDPVATSECIMGTKNDGAQTLNLNKGADYDNTVMHDGTNNRSSQDMIRNMRLDAISNVTTHVTQCEIINGKQTTEGPHPDPFMNELEAGEISSNDNTEHIMCCNERFVMNEGELTVLESNGRRLDTTGIPTYLVSRDRCQQAASSQSLIEFNTKL